VFVLAIVLLCLHCLLLFVCLFFLGVVSGWGIEKKRAQALLRGTGRELAGMAGGGGWGGGGGGGGRPGGGGGGGGGGGRRRLVLVTRLAPSWRSDFEPVHPFDGKPQHTRRFLREDLVKIWPWSVDVANACELLVGQSGGAE